MKVMFKNRFLVAAPLVLIALTLASFFSLTTRSVSADDVVDDVSIRVNVSCTMSGSGMNTHNAIVNPGTFETNIGETTFRVFCNDNEGFAVYAIGYTDDDEGKNVLTSSDVGSSFDIATGIGTSGNSQWAMKLATDSNATYPVTLQNNFDDWHTVPDDYTLVAKRTAHTDVGMNAVGANFTSTYQVFISSSQPAGNYNGRVKYVMVHPNNGDNPVKSNQIGVVFDGNGLTFPGGLSENRVVYGGEDCIDAYVGEPTIVKTSNIADDGTLISPYRGESELETVSFEGADSIQVVVTYGVSYNNTIFVEEGEWDGSSAPSASVQYVGGYSCESALWERCDGIKTFSLDSDTVTIYISGNDGGDYGMYARVYPIYENGQIGTTKKLICEDNSIIESGAYTETNVWNDRWYAKIEETGYVSTFADENAILDFLEENQTFLHGTTIRFYAFHPYRISYNGNNATAGTMNGYYEVLGFIPEATMLAAPNYYRSNYGFVGWSEDQNAVVGSSRIFGPNESIDGTELHFSNDTHETTLYAVWAQSAGSLQNWAGCNSLEQGQVTALSDSRDNNTYAVAKLADGMCWMIENLRLDAANSSDDQKAQGFGDAFSGLANSENSLSATTTANSKYSTSNILGSNQAYRIPRYNNSNTNSPVANMITADANIYGYGNYYNWPAAMANTANMISNISESANTSICPAGWGLPHGGESGSGNENGGFNYLAYKINNDDWNINYDDVGTISFSLRKFPNNFVYSGSMSGTYIGSRVYKGQYWSSTAIDSTSAYYFLLGDTFLNTSGAKSNGIAVRCVYLGFN